MDNSFGKKLGRLLYESKMKKLPFSVSAKIADEIIKEYKQLELWEKLQKKKFLIK